MNHPNMKRSFKAKILLIGGLDSSGGAGLQRDLAFFENDQNLRIIPSFYSVQSTQSFHQSVQQSFFKKYLKEIEKNWLNEYVFIKVGALSETWQVKEIIKTKKKLKRSFLIYDPIIQTSSGHPFIYPQMLKFIKKNFLSHVDLLTPNIDEFEILFQKKIQGLKDFKLGNYSNALLIKGGHHYLHLDFFQEKNISFYMKSPFIKSTFRGTGCSYASLILKGLSEGLYLEDAVVLAKGILSSNLSKDQPYVQLKKSVPNLPQISWDGSFQKIAFKKIPFDHLTFYPIVSNSDQLKKIVDLKPKIVQLRIKDKDEISIRHQIKECKKLCSLFGTLLFINDYWEIALEEKVDGIHLGFEDLQTANLAKISKANLYLGVSSHSYLEGAYVAQFNPSYIALGPIFKTKLKKMRFRPQGVETLKIWKQIFNFPIVAIGGINLDNADFVFKQKPNLICSVQDIWLNINPKLRFKKWQQKIHSFSSANINSQL